MKKALILAFARGMGGGLALAATPIVLGWGAMAMRGGARVYRGAKGAAADVGDCFRYYGELREHRARSRRPHQDPGNEA